MADVVAAGRWQVGSDFEWDDRALQRDSSPHLPPPWLGAVTEPATYVQSGRQALSLLSGILRAQGRSRVFCPAHVCDSMLLPFVRDGWELHPVPVDHHLRASVLPPQASSSAAVVLSLSYFGAPEGDTWLESLDRARDAGAFVVSDETQRVLGPGLAWADARIGSLRKMLPVPDGAFVVAAGLSDVDLGSAADALAERRVRAMQDKAAWLVGRGGGSFRAVFQQVEAELEQESPARSMSRASHELVERLDYPYLARRRTSNAERLAGRLDGSRYEAVDRHDGLPMSHVVVSGPDIVGLRSHLQRHQVFCPVHWPRPRGVRWPVPWRDDVLSLPNDHRYDVGDMDHLADLVLGYRTSEES